MKERIAHFADIDTRRAMGFGPQRLVIPDIQLRIPWIREVAGPHEGYGPPKPLSQQNLKLPTIDPVAGIYNFMYVVDFENGIRLNIYNTCTSWYFYQAHGDFQYKTHYSFSHPSKQVTFSDRLSYNCDIHPDFNDDGSFKRAKPL